jgi:hypothetical protein
VVHKPSSNVSFRSGDDFVNRGDILQRVDERCSRRAGRAALVGPGGFGWALLPLGVAEANNV